MSTNPTALIQKLQQTGLLPMLMQKLSGQQSGPQGQPSKPQGAPATPPPNVGGPGQPGVGGSPPGASAGGPNVKFDPSGAGAAMPPPIAQPHEAVQSIAGLLMNWNNRKKKGEEAEAANIAQNLIQAIRNNDKETINDILNNDHSKKILNKVYKGWLTKAEEAQKPGKEQDPTVSGFEAGIQKATSQPQGQPPAQPNVVGGSRLPMPAPQDQLGAAKLSAETQAAKQDPNRLLSSRLSSEEMRETELGAGPAKVEAEQAKAKAATEKAAQDVRKAQLEVQKVEAELELKKTEGETAKTKGAEATAVEHQKYLKALVDLDVARERLKLSIVKTKKGTDVTFATKLKMSAIDKAIAITTKIQDEKRSFSASDFGDLASELRAAGATELIKKLPQNWLSAHLLSGKDDVTDLLGALQHYKESYQAVINDVGKTDKKDATTSSGEEEDDSDEPMEGDVVDGFRFKGGDPSVQSNWEPVKKPD